MTGCKKIHLIHYILAGQEIRLQQTNVTNACVLVSIRTVFFLLSVTVQVGEITGIMRIYRINKYKITNSALSLKRRKNS